MTENPFKTYQVPITKPIKQPKIDFRFQELGIEMEKYFKKNIWYIFHKYEEIKIRDAFKICQERGNTSVSYLVGIIKRLK